MPYEAVPRSRATSVAAECHPVCELCGDATPARRVRSDPARGWDVLCPACWRLNTAREEPVQDHGLFLAAADWVVRLSTPEPHLGLWTEAEAQRYAHAQLSAAFDQYQRASPCLTSAQESRPPEDPAASRPRHGQTRLSGTRCVCAVCREGTPQRRRTRTA